MNLKNTMMAAALGLSAASLGGCASVNNLNMETCIKTDALGPKPTLPPIIKWLIPGYNYTRPNAPCNHSQYFMALVGLTQIPGNENNWRMQKLVIDAYDVLKNAAPKDKYARDTLGMIDSRLEGEGLKIDDFRQSFAANKPRIVGGAQENNCWNYKTQESGRIYDDRICMTVNLNMPNPN